MKRTDEYADGEYNSTLETEATSDGLELDLGITIPWEWIDEARASLSQPSIESIMEKNAQRPE